MSGKGVPNRWLVVLGAVLIQVCLGAIYAWSVFTPALIAAGWSKLQTQMVFSVGLVTFAVVMVWAGRRLPVWGPRKLVWLGGAVLGLGYLMAGLFGATSLLVVTLSIGLVGGAGIGMGYVVPIAVGMRWFPDKKGLITGLAVAGFGFGAMAWVKLAGAWGNLIATTGLAWTFSAYGIAFAVLIFIGGVWMTMPPQGWLPKGYKPPEASGSKAAGSEEFSVGRMLETPQFYLIFLTFTISAGAGLMSIGLMKLYPIEALTSAGLSSGEASAVAGTAMAVFFSLANGLGRIAWGSLSDKLGRKRSILIMTSSQGFIIMAFTLMAGTPWLLYLGAALIGFNFGGNFALFPTITADTFGTKRVGQNYPYVFLSYGVGGILGPFLGGILGDMGNFPLAFSICGIACIFGAGCISMVSPPRREAFTGLAPAEGKATTEEEGAFSHRELRPEDAAEICEFPESERELFHMFPKASYPLKPQVLLENAAERHNPTVVLLDGKLAGYANFITCEREGMCELGNVIVNPEFRRRGVGRFLLETMARKARAEYGCATLRAGVFNDNTLALLFYAGQGFAPVGVAPREGVDGSATALLHLDKKLQG